ncbi:MAG: hypothetical protein COU35_00490 [Candidatus Magasanikbacteria bacterium CG10_big_fil_rev_8_21_14_0_10_47_10]|uniref:Uncharacterized protein n=1 Tax=Candidatus Magasanikbacteria bacterium CG10_big_fil_rev_8_21_14_0_10_47_10 TaxID=1974652 RepID=A0A2H0TRR9_9BACT|nr:MAG: hypothetical protein COU35_00490 [Candidatus Magasanikbacteria bacterium CG10_big_fil_rev_8_21_14_0_10_47_10]
MGVDYRMDGVQKKSYTHKKTIRAIPFTRSPNQYPAYESLLKRKWTKKRSNKAKKMGLCGLSTALLQTTTRIYIIYTISDVTLGTDNNTHNR